jgi:hypothetical protein
MTTHKPMSDLDAALERANAEYFEACSDSDASAQQDAVQDLTNAYADKIAALEAKIDEWQKWDKRQDKSLAKERKEYDIEVAKLLSHIVILERELAELRENLTIPIYEVGHRKVVSNEV